MGDLSVLITIWAAVGASGLSAGGVGVYLTRRRLRLVEPKVAAPVAGKSDKGLVAA